jgi:hypothetical protein
MVKLEILNTHRCVNTAVNNDDLMLHERAIPRKAVYVREYVCLKRENNGGTK